MQNNPDYMAGPFDRCLKCPYLGNGCSGPRTTTMEFDRWLWWVKALKQRKGYTNVSCVDGTGLAKTTVDNIINGKIKDVSRSTAGLLEDYLIGGAAKWPCAMDLVTDKEVVFEDREETLAALAEKTAQVENLRRHLDDFKGIMDREVAAVREKMQKEVDFLKEQVIFQREQIARKDEHINALLTAARNGGKL